MTQPQSLPRLWSAGAAGVIGWLVLLSAAVADVGATGYYSDLAARPSYLISWLTFLTAALVLTLTPPVSQAKWEFELRLGLLLGLGPEILLTLPLLLGLGDLENVQSWPYVLDAGVRWLQTPGRLLSWPLGGMQSRWAVGLSDPPTWAIARALVVLNIANVVGWSVVVGMARSSYLRWTLRRTGLRHDA